MRSCWLLPALCGLLCAAPLAEGAAKFAFVGKWRGEHGTSIGLCTAELVAKEWILTAAHCATRILKKEPVTVRVRPQLSAQLVNNRVGSLATWLLSSSQVTFEHSSGNVERGVTHCISLPDEDVALCKLKLPVNAFAPAVLNSDVYTTSNHGGSVLCVGTAGGFTVVGPKALVKYEAGGAHLYVDNTGGSGMKAGDSGGAWLRAKTVGNQTQHFLSGVIHGGMSEGGKKLGVAGQPSHPATRKAIDQHTNSTATWASCQGWNPSAADV